MKSECKTGVYLSTVFQCRHLPLDQHPFRESRKVLSQLCIPKYGSPEEGKVMSGVVNEKGGNKRTHLERLPQNAPKMGP